MSDAEFREAVRLLMDEISGHVVFTKHYVENDDCWLAYIDGHLSLDLLNRIRAEVALPPLK